MRRYVEPLYQYKPEDIELSDSEVPDLDADVNIHVPWHTAIDLEKGESKNVIVFTHLNPGMEAALSQAVNNSDHILVMATDAQRLLEGCGKPVTITTPGIDGFQPRKIRIGIVGSEQPNGRKRSWILTELAWKVHLDHFQFFIIGTGWEQAVKHASSLGVSIEYHETVTQEELLSFYHYMDYLLVTGFREGGPLPLIEALACGVSVIAPPVGFALDLVNPQFIYNSVEELGQILREIKEKVLVNRHSVEHLTNKIYVDTVFNICREVILGKRYENLYRIIQEIKPQSLVEIGVASGKRAKLMIEDAQKYQDPVTYIGLDFFRPLSYEEKFREFSLQPASLQEVHNYLTPTKAFVQLIEGDTRETLYKDYLTFDTPKDFIFIDGGHSWETIESDWNGVQRLIHKDTVIVFDDYYSSNPEGIGCQHLINSLDKETWNVELLEPVESLQGLMDVQMVKVSRK